LRLAVVIGLVGDVRRRGEVPTGGELALFEAVGWWV
jgi:hypothetical protein